MTVYRNGVSRMGKEFDKKGLDVVAVLQPEYWWSYKLIYLFKLTCIF
jgi:hypothetical protein